MLELIYGTLGWVCVFGIISGYMIYVTKLIFSIFASVINLIKGV